ncbi:MAG TPA: hypothetical protein VI913_04815 [Candidatus Peribacteraceae bacterium]|nr:hypothetical protein [Candidatus Peribacteraceae bacterium]
MANSPSGTGEFYTTRALKATKDYLPTKEEPFAPIALPTNYFHTAFKWITDGFRVFQGKDREPLEPLGDFTRTKESSVGAVMNIGKGVGKVVTGKPVKGVLQIAEGVANVPDIFVSAVADGMDKIAGVRHVGNTTRQKIGQTLRKAA